MTYVGLENDWHLYSHFTRIYQNGHLGWPRRGMLMSVGSPLSMDRRGAKKPIEIPILATVTKRYPNARRARSNLFSSLISPLKKRSAAPRAGFAYMPMLA